MNPLIDVGLWAVVLMGLVALRPFLRELFIALAELDELSAPAEPDSHSHARSSQDPEPCHHNSSDER